MPGQITKVALENRSSKRRPVLLLGTIHLERGETIPCVVRDVSAGGAKLSVGQRHQLPGYFVLSIPGRKGAFRVRLAWRQQNYAGVEIVAIAPVVPGAVGLDLPS